MLTFEHKFAALNELHLFEMNKFPINWIVIQVVTHKRLQWRFSFSNEMKKVDDAQCFIVAKQHLTNGTLVVKFGKIQMYKTNANVDWIKDNLPQPMHFW